MSVVSYPSKLKMGNGSIVNSWTFSELLEWMVLVKLVRRWWTLLAAIILKDDCSASLTVKVIPFLELFQQKLASTFLMHFGEESLTGGLGFHKSLKNSFPTSSVCKQYKERKSLTCTHHLNKCEQNFFYLSGKAEAPEARGLIGHKAPLVTRSLVLTSPF